MTAKQTYQNTVKSINDSIKELQKQLKEHEQKFKEDPTNWGYVGDIQHTDMKLKELINKK